jgi:ABC-type amino acid transport substrate-binding protein/ABC-type amino acid transport system permease subunit
VLLVLLGAVGPARALSPDEALQDLLNGARSQLPGACGEESADLLIHILCAGEIRVGIRGNYPLFATSQGDDRAGYDVDVARAIAARLGVEPRWVYVRAATRISALAEGEADVVIATLGHNTRRDAEARFIRPHYYRSETIVVGGNEIRVDGWEDLAGRPLCVTIGNYSNAHIVSQNARLMLFDDAARLTEGLRNESCLLAAQDDSFFASYLADPDFAARFEVKFGFDAVPWGMAVAQTGSEQLAKALQLISQIMHRDGEYLAIAQRVGIFTTFLEEQQRLWRTPACATAAAVDDPRCVLPALEATPPPTSFAGQVEQAQAWMERHLGVAPSLPMLTSAPAWSLFKAGIVNSVILVFGALVATLVFALLTGAAAAARNRLFRALATLVVVTLQSSPVVLTLVVAAAVAHAMFTYSAGVALGAAIVALGLMNGCNAGQAIGEAADSLRRDGTYPDRLTLPLFAAAVGRSITQILSFLVNATKGTPIASFIGAPELLGALTDITSFAAGQTTTYTFVLLFYIGVVIVVVWACERLRVRLERAGAAP